MKVEIVSQSKQRFNGNHYWAGAPRYYRRVFRKKSYLLHREVWKHHNGKIPPNMHIHHKDNNWHNNQIENLECLTPQDHLKIQTPEATANRRKHIEDIRHLAVAWHKSDEAKSVHSEIGRKSWVNREWFERDCDYCTKTYKTAFPNRSKYCHQNCKASHRRYRIKVIQSDKT